MQYIYNSSRNSIPWRAFLFSVMWVLSCVTHLSEPARTKIREGKSLTSLVLGVRVRRWIEKESCSQLIWSFHHDNSHIVSRESSYKSTAKWNIMRLLCASVVLLAAFSSAFGWKVFHLGKFWGPRRLDSQLSAQTSFADIWFDQKLDHFDPTNGDKWKQVKTFIILLLKI